MGANGPEVTREPHADPHPTPGKPRAGAGNRTPNLLITNPPPADSGTEIPLHDAAMAGQFGRNRPAKRTTKTWRHSVGTKRRNRVTVYERAGKIESLYVEWTHGKRRFQRSLESVVGYPVTDRDDAVRIAVSLSENIARLRAAEATRELRVAAEHEAHRVSRLLDLSDDELLAARLPSAPLVGIYFLMLAGSVVYIGQSKHILRRVWEHRRKPVVAFDAVAWVPVDQADLGEAERRLIARFRPPGNLMFNGDGP